MGNSLPMCFSEQYTRCRQPLCEYEPEQHRYYQPSGRSSYAYYTWSDRSATPYPRDLYEDQMVRDSRQRPQSSVRYVYVENGIDRPPRHRSLQSGAPGRSMRLGSWLEYDDLQWRIIEQNTEIARRRPHLRIGLQENPVAHQEKRVRFDLPRVRQPKPRPSRCCDVYGRAALGQL
jgi:hypothetical protein